MYQEETNKVSFIRVLLRILLFVLIFILCIKLIVFFFNKTKKNNADTVMDSNLTVLKDAGIKIIRDDNFNIKVGEVKTYKLKDLIDNNQVEEIKDENNNVCSSEDSYIEITRTETEYRIKSYLSCDNKKDDKYTYVDVKTKEEIKDQTNNNTTEPATTTVTTTTVKSTTTTTKKTTTKAKTTKKVTTTKKVNTTKTVRTTTTIPSNKAKVSFNTNGGNQLNPIIIDKNTCIELPIPTRNGYTFYRWEDSSGKVYGRCINTDHNVVLVAKWR